MDDPLQSLSKGVFVLPFSPQDEATEVPPDQSEPVVQELFDEIYASTLNSIEEAYSVYEEQRTQQQISNVLSWLERCNEPQTIQLIRPIHRLPVAVLQNASESLPSHFSQLDIYHHTVQGARSFTDLASAIRSIAIGFIGDATVSGKRTGRSGIDELELWWKSKTERPLLIHVRDAQMIPSSVLSELIFTLTLHPAIPLRVLLSVPSSAVFLSTWGHIEPSAVDMCILQAGRIKKKAGGVDAIIRAFERAPLKISDNLADELLTQEDQLDGGPAAALKTLKWALLDFYVDGPLAVIIQNADTAEKQRKILQLFKIIRANPAKPDVPESVKYLLNLTLHDNLLSVHDPSPRLSFLHALSNPEQFVSLFDAYNGQSLSTDARDIAPGPSERAEKQSAERSNKRPRLEAPRKDESVRQVDLAEELKRLKVLFGIWKEAGKSVNLWDWLEEFRDVMDESNAEGKENAGGRGEGEGKESELEISETHAEHGVGGANGNSNGDRIGRKQEAEEEERLHAIFVRFVEEARMLGLIRAKGKKADEVLKSVGLI
ncbi:hypothetical protein L198_05045 [Cryptococcus wingfieldii CBS 7118]|uniref:Origin recognition complex subunit 3 winged helix C-terminal domain-containing protein n=1 Tax=Cryptococcus wingfieldii CBS 7118 TaxID=1295528 RepID=A0A1E3J028_9TREE|nr:hypothetical protein L198_05045 [Cryptococcus wingfieldii CBS 7118]ODN94194.1 hypothetical protein L198_05045 [Cryptococcus wingfieldii CBS 7118]